MKAIYWLLPIIFLNICLSARAESLPELDINKDTKSLSIGKHLEILEDPSGKMTLAQVRASANARLWHKSQWETPNFGFTKSAYWVRFKLRNPEPESMNLVVEISYIFLDYIELYAFEKNQNPEVWKGGDRYVFDQRQILNNNHLFQLTLAPKKTKSIYIRIQSSSSLQIPITIYRTISFIEIKIPYIYMEGALFGLIFIMALYNLFIFISVRDISYIYYVTFITIVGMLVLSFEGLSFWLFWPQSPWLANLSVPFLICLGMALMIQFTRSFLNTKRYAKYMDNILVGSMILEGILVILSFFLEYRTILLISIPATIVVSSCCIAGGFIAYRNGNKAARFFLVAWLTMLFGGIIYNLKIAGLLPSNYVTENGLYIGISLEGILFSFALADRINIMKAEKEKAQQYALKVEAEAKEKLERTVTERTRELANANEKLKQLATTDALTGLHNRRVFDETLTREFSRAKRNRLDMSLLMIDVDNFKLYNDTYGHKMGDACLQKVALIAQAEIKRAHDIIARYGGEEFAAVLCDISVENAVGLAEDIRKSIQSEKIPHEKSSFNVVTVSIGVTGLDHAEDINQSEFFSKADQALYQAKEMGRNRVVVN